MTASPRIVHVITRMLRGGTEENTMLCCRAQAKAGSTVAIAHGRDIVDSYLSAPEPDVDLIAVPSLIHPISPLADLRALRELTAVFKTFAPDIVHTHQSKAGIVGRIAGRRAGAKAVVHTVHIIPFTNVSPLKKLIYVLVEKFAARYCDAMIFVSEGARSEYAHLNIGRSCPAHVIPSGMEIGRFRDYTGDLQSEDARRIAGAHSDKLKVLYLSSFEERKRHEPLVAALAEMAGGLDGCHVMFAGEGRTKERVRSQVDALGLSENLSILDHTTVPEDLIAISDLCIYVSEREGLPRAVIQYLASGKPVVVADLPGIGEIVNDGVNGVVTPAHDMAGLVAVIRELRDDPNELARLASGARETDTSRWDANVMTTEVAAIYKEILKRRGA